MKGMTFQQKDILTVSDALDIAEDVTGNYFKCSAGEWGRNQYEVKTLRDLSGPEISSGAFAVLNKGSGPLSRLDPRSRIRDYYCICLQDHQILKAMKEDRHLGLLPLLTYVFTHELIHMVRFSNFLQRFEVSGMKKEREEKQVHGITYEILTSHALPGIDYVLGAYQGHRVCDQVYLG